MNSEREDLTRSNLDVSKGYNYSERYYQHEIESLRTTVQQKEKEL